MKASELLSQNSKHLSASAIPLEPVLAGIMIIALAMIMITNVFFLTETPPVFIDESWNANTAWNWLQTGNNFDSMHSGALDQFGNEWLRWPKIGNLPWRLSYAIFGLGLSQARIVSWLFGVILLLATILVGRRTYGLLAGALAALLLSLSPPFMQASHYARWDIMLVAVAMLAYWLAINGMEGNKWWSHVLAGLLIGLSLDIHQNAVLFMLGFGVLYIVNYGKSVFKRRGTWLFSLGAIIGVGYFVATFILPDPEAYFRLFSLSLGNTHQVPISTLNPLILLQSIDDEIGRYHFFENSLAFALISASVVYLLLRRSKHDQLLLSFVGAIFAGFVLLIGNKHDIYAILLYPFFMLLVAETIISLVRSQQGFDKQRLFVGTLLAAFLISGGIHFARTMFDNRNYNYYAITEKIEPLIPPGGRVMGLPDWWLGLAEYDYRSSLNLTYYHFLNDYSLTEGLEEIRPDVLILDEDLQALLVNEGAYKTNSGFEIYQLPRQEFEGFLAKQGEKVLEFWDPWHGWFDIYTIRWDQDLEA